MINGKGECGSPFFLCVLVGLDSELLIDKLSGIGDGFFLLEEEGLAQLIDHLELLAEGIDKAVLGAFAGAALLVPAADLVALERYFEEFGELVFVFHYHIDPVAGFEAGELAEVGGGLWGVVFDDGGGELFEALFDVLFEEACGGFLLVCRFRLRTVVGDA